MVSQGQEPQEHAEEQPIQASDSAQEPGGGPVVVEPVQEIDSPLESEKETDELRMAHAYAEAYPRQEEQARADIYGEENPHFTVQRARVQVSILVL